MVGMVPVTVMVESFALCDTFERVPDVEFDTAPVVAHEAGTAIPLLWASTDDPGAVREALKADSTTVDASHLTEHEEQSLYRVEWQPAVNVVVEGLLVGQGSLLDAHGSQDGWSFRLLFRHRSSVDALADRCRDLGLDAVVQGPAADFTKGATNRKKQAKALAAALGVGYYAVPRRRTLEDVADEVGVSHQALSERLRRGQQGIIAHLVEAPVRLGRRSSG
jgi:predicted DNA binding protein